MKVAVIAVFTALSLGTNYAMIDLPNVKLMDALVFIAAFLFGLRVGVGSAISIWAVYGFVNPYGQADFVTLVFVMLGECFYAVSGALLSRTAVARDLVARDLLRLQVRIYGRMNIRLMDLRLYLRMIVVFGLTGLQATFAYDVLTNFGSWLFKTSSIYQALIIGIITGAPFAVLHEGSNLLFFATVVPSALAASKRLGLITEARTE